MSFWSMVRWGALSLGLVCGGFMAVMMAFDVYPFVPDEGFGVGRKVQDVLALTAWGAVVGAGIGALCFALKSATRVLLRR